MEKPDSIFAFEENSLFSFKAGSVKAGSFVMPCNQGCLGDKHWKTNCSRNDNNMKEIKMEDNSHIDSLIAD